MQQLLELINYCKWNFLTCRGWILGKIGSVLVCCSSPKYPLFSTPSVSLGGLSRRKLNTDIRYGMGNIKPLGDFKKPDTQVTRYNNEIWERDLISFVLFCFVFLTWLWFQCAANFGTQYVKAWFTAILTWSSIRGYTFPPIKYLLWPQSLYILNNGPQQHIQNTYTPLNSF